MDKALLKDGAKIVEEDENIAALLQSLDADGNPENGITIKEDVVKTLSTALNENGGSIPKTAEALETAVAALGEVEGYHGHIRGNEEVKAHLMQTQATVLKALIAGKEFYLINHNNTDGWFTEKIKFNTDAEKYTITDSKETETNSIKIEGNKLHVDDNEYLTFKKTTAKYLEFKSLKSQEIVKLYFNKADAEADAATQNGNSNHQNEENNPSSQSNTNPCHVEGKTVSADEGQTCNYKNHTVACQSGRVTLDGTFSAQKLNINGTKYTCSK